MSYHPFFSIARKLLDSIGWLSEPFTRGQAWVDMIGKANFSDGFRRIRGIKVDVPRGYLPFSEVELAARWQWSRGKVRRFLSELETEQQIEQQKTNVTTLIKILNYESYQHGGTPNNTANGQQTDSKRTATTIIDKNDKNDKKEYLSDSIEYRLADYLFKHIIKNNPNAKKPNLKSWAKHIDYMIRIDGRDAKEIKHIIEFSQRDSFWMTNILSTLKLREKFDQLYLKSGENKKSITGASGYNAGYKMFDPKDMPNG